MFKILRNFLVVFFLIYPSTEARNFYRILDVPSSASARQIKKAFRKLSLKYHPDKCEECKEQFTDVNSAYECLSDPKKRQVYDSVGGDEESYKTRLTQTQTRSHEMPKAANTRMTLYVDLRTLYVGRTFEVRFFRDTLCQRVDECEKNDSGCARAGVRKTTRRLGGIFVQQVEEVDTNCVAEGKKYLKNCGACPDGPNVEDEISVTIDISPGMKNGQEIIFEEYGDEKIGHVPGDLIISLKQKPHTHFEREGDDLKVRIGINLLDAVTGFQRTIQHVDGHDVLISSDEVIDCSSVKVINKEGMQKESGGFGNLIVTFDIAFPSKKFTTEEKTYLRKILKD